MSIEHRCDCDKIVFFKDGQAYDVYIPKRFLTRSELGQLIDIYKGCEYRAEIFYNRTEKDVDIVYYTWDLN